MLGGSATNFTMYCNDKNGYIIYAIGASNNEEGNTNLIGDNGNNITTGVYPGNGSNTTSLPSSWSMKLNTNDADLTLNSNYNDSFNLIPSTWTEVIRKQSGTVDSTVGSHASATYDAYVNGIQAAGTYIGQVKYVMFHPSSATRPVTLAKAFENAGKQKVHATDPLTGESGEFYKMQDMTSAICNATNVMGEASQIKLVDTRDNKLYWVTKLRTDAIDDTIGQCWMTRNLDLDLISDPQAEEYVALTSNNTNLKLYGSYGYDSSNGYICSNDNPTCENGVITWMPERSTIQNGDLDSNTWKNKQSTPYSYDRGLIAPNGNMNGHGFTGNYYNWTAAVASNNSSSYNGGGNAANSVCPKGWRLPNVLPEKVNGYEFSRLFYAYGITKDATNGTGYAGSNSQGLSRIISSPLYFVRSGQLYTNSIRNYNSNGHYWSSAADSSSFGGFYYSYYLVFSSGGISPSFYVNVGYESSRSYGQSIRCLAE